MSIGKINKDIYQNQINSDKTTKINKDRYDLIADLTLKNVESKSPKILDIGCRDCAYFDNIKSEIPNAELKGIDNVPKFIEKGKKKGYNVIDHNLENPLPFKKGEFDLINCQQVLEHLLDTQEFVRECHRKLKKEGKLIIGIPNFASLPSRIRFLFGFKPLQYSPVLQWSFGNHKSMFTLRDFKKILIDNNFEIEQIYGVDLYASLTDYNKGLSLKWIAKLFPSLAQKVIIIAKK